MGKVTITFSGICTHFLNPTADVQHRVVLINASEGKTVDGVHIAPHIALLQIGGAAPETISLDGVRLSIGNATGDLLYIGYESMPSLRKEMDSVAPLPPPSPKLLLDEPWPEIAAYFDLDHGSISACIDEMGSARATVTMTTSGDEVELVLEPFPGSAFAGTTRLLASPATIIVSNLSTMEEMERSHFLLHYTLGETLAKVPQIPRRIEGPRCPAPTYGTIGAGCSNSNYP